MKVSNTFLIINGLVLTATCIATKGSASGELLMSRIEGFFSTVANTTDIINHLVNKFSKNSLQQEPPQTIMNKQETPENSMTLESDLYLTLLQGLSSLFRYGKDTAAVVILWTIILGPVVAILSTIPMTAVVFAAMYLTPLLDLSRIREWVFPEYPLPSPPIRF